MQVYILSHQRDEVRMTKKDKAPPTHAPANRRQQLPSCQAQPSCCSFHHLVAKRHSSISISPMPPRLPRHRPSFHRCPKLHQSHARQPLSSSDMSPDFHPHTGPSLLGYRETLNQHARGFHVLLRPPTVSLSSHRIAATLSPENAALDVAIVALPRISSEPCFLMAVLTVAPIC